jgi:hypothetical protein
VGDVTVPPRRDPSPGLPHPDPERLALAALPAEPHDPALDAHLRACTRCRAEVDDLRRAVELAREGADSRVPGGGLGEALPRPPEHVWRGIAAELGLSGEHNGQVGGTHAPVHLGGEGDLAGGPETNGQVDRPAAAVEPEFVRGPAGWDEVGRHRRSRRRWRRIGVAAAAAVIGLVVGLGVGRALAPEPGPAPLAGPAVRLAPVGGLDPGASGTVAMAEAGGERQMVVQVQGVTNMASGDHLEAWLMDASGTQLVPLGALDGADGDFHGTFALPEGVPLGVFGQVDVSAERWDGNPGHSTQSVLRGAL